MRYKLAEGLTELRKISNGNFTIESKNDLLGERFYCWYGTGKAKRGVCYHIDAEEEADTTINIWIEELLVCINQLLKNRG